MQKFALKAQAEKEAKEEATQLRAELNLRENDLQEKEAEIERLQAAARQQPTLNEKTIQSSSKFIVILLISVLPKIISAATAATSSAPACPVPHHPLLLLLSLLLLLALPLPLPLRWL